MVEPATKSGESRSVFSLITIRLHLDISSAAYYAVKETKEG